MAREREAEAGEVDELMGSREHQDVLLGARRSLSAIDGGMCERERVCPSALARVVRVCLYASACECVYVRAYVDVCARACVCRCVCA